MGVVTYEVGFLDEDGEGWSTEAEAAELSRVIEERVRRGCIITSVTPVRTNGSAR